MWGLPEPGIEPMSPEPAGRFLPTGSPGEPLTVFATVGASFSNLSSKLLCISVNPAVELISRPKRT